MTGPGSGTTMNDDDTPQVHTGDDGHPELEGDGRSTRDLGGPKAEEGAEGSDGTPEGAKGDIETKGFESHS